MRVRCTSTRQPDCALIPRLSSSEITISDSDSSLEVMGVALSQPSQEESSVQDSQLESILATDLTQMEKSAYMEVLRCHFTMFISNYEHITGVTAIQHHIHLKEEAKPVAQKLQRLGVIQQVALLKEMQKLLKEGFIYPVEDSEWVLPVVVVPKKNNKWRIYADFKPLSAATKRDQFLLPFQDEILNEVAGYER